MAPRDPIPAPVPPSELTYLIEASPDLAQWQQGSWYSDFGLVASNALTTEVSGSPLTVVRMNSTVQGAPQGFLRVRAQERWR